MFLKYAIVFLVMVVAPIAGVYFVLREKRIYLKLRDGGIRTKATVILLYLESSGGWGRAPAANYAFHVKGERYIGTAGISKKLYKSLQVGSEIEIFFDPNEPTLSRAVEQVVFRFF